ncbi:MAG: NusG domain II-containing protein [Saccharofermentanales bacterium]
MDSRPQDTTRIFDKMKWGDFLIVFIVVVLSFSLWSKILFARSTTARTAEIVAEGEIVLRYELATGRLLYENEDIASLLDEYSPGTDESGNPLISIAENNIHFTILIKGGKIRFFKSDCPNQVCVNTGFISVSGQIAACVPAGVLARVAGMQAEDDPDIIIG